MIGRRWEEEWEVPSKKEVLRRGKDKESEENGVLLGSPIVYSVSY